MPILLVLNFMIKLICSLLDKADLMIMIVLQSHFILHPCHFLFLPFLSHSPPTPPCHTSYFQISWCV